MIGRSPRISVVGIAMLALLAMAVPGQALARGTAPAAATAMGAVYSLTNAAGPTGNAVIVYHRAADGTLTSAGPNVATGGLGTGSGLGSQGALVLGEGGSVLVAVNAGSNTISSFAVQSQGLHLVSQVNAGGTMPISLAFRGHRLYVLNAGSSSIAGFAVNVHGVLSRTPITNSVQPLNPTASSPEEIAFNPTGTILAVTDKGSGQIDTYVVAADGSVSGPTTFSTGAVGPYALAFTPAGQAVVSDAGIGALSSYTVSASGALGVISSQIPDSHAAPCWLVITTNGTYAYTANAHDGTISSYTIAADGSLGLLQALAAGPVATPLLDMALSHSSRFLYADDNGLTVAFQVQSNGSLTPLPGGTGLVVGQGIAAL